MPALSPLRVRDATIADMAAITHIYAWHVLHGCGSFEETPPDIVEMTTRHARVFDLQFPWLVAEMHGQVAGFAYASLYRPRAAYRFTVEDSVYIAAHLGGRGIGSALPAAILSANAGDRRRRASQPGIGQPA